MKTKSRNILLILSMALGLLFAMSAVAFADDGQVIEWRDEDSLPSSSGVYRLETTVSLQSSYSVPRGTDITIDLNGNEITCAGEDVDSRLIDVYGKLTINDSGEGGIILSNYEDVECIIMVWGGSEFNLSGGKIDNRFNNCGVDSDHATINISGGEIIAEGDSSQSYAIDDSGSTISVSGGTFSSRIRLSDGTNFTATGGEFRWEIMNDGATISLSGGRYNDANGTVRNWVADGFTQIKISGSFVEVVKGVSSITLDGVELDVTEGESKTLQATVLPEDAYNKDVVWSSINPAVATVSNEGVVFGKSCGETTITAEPVGQPGRNADNDARTAACKIYVLPDIWWKKADNKLYLRAGQEEGYTQYNPNKKWGFYDYTRVVVENTIRPDDMTNWFNAAEDLEEIVNPENIDTSSVRSMFGLFYSCKKLQSLDLSTWDTSSVTSMESMFSFCNALTELDLTSFDVSNVQKMTSMFENCSALKTIYVSNGTDWKTQSRVADSDDMCSNEDMFKNCTQLTGEQGTTYAENRINADYAHIDGGEDAPGYFTGIYKITFEDGMGHVIKKELLKRGERATAPTDDPTRDGYVFGGWDQDFSKITSDLTVTPKWRQIIDNAKVVLSATSLTYNGKVQKPKIKTIKGLTLKEGTDYAAKWSNPSSKNVGTYTVTVTGTGKYIGTTKATYKIIKAAQSITKVTPASKTYKAVKKTKKLGKTYTFTLKVTGKGNGKTTFKKANKAGASKITVSKAGKVTVKKGLKKGTYKVKVKVSKAANTNYKAASKTVTVKIIVK